MAKNMTQKISVLLSKLGDRDTFAMAAKELESIARGIDPAAGNLQPFISVIPSADAGYKLAVRKHCVHLLAVMSLSLPPNSLSPFLSKILTRLTRRLRDPDSSIRSTCVAAVSALSSRTTKPPFDSAFLKPLSDALFTEQETNAQTGAALCLAAAIDAAPDPDPDRLGRVLLPRLEKLVKCDAFKAKAAGLVVIGSVISSGGIAGSAVGFGGLKGLVDCLLSFLGSEDWAGRKAAAEALGRLAAMERDNLAEFKTRCLKIFESRKYDKVKAVREVMNQMIEAWKQVPDISDEISPPRSNASSKDDASDGRYPSGSKVASTPGIEFSKRGRTLLARRSTPPESSIATTARQRTNIKSSEKKTGLVSHIKPNTRRRLDWKSGASVSTAVTVDEERQQDENVKESGQTHHEKVQRSGGTRSLSYPPPSGESSRYAAATGHVMSENQNIKFKGFEDLALIRNQLVQIEQQQSSLMDVLQRFVGSSEKGMCALETRVHGLELALDEISYDLAVLNGRMTTGSDRSNCCLLPGAGFIRPKFWRKPEPRYPASRLSNYAGTPSVYRSGNAQTVGFQGSRMRLNGTARFIVNPLAEIPSDSFATVEPTGMLRN
ncbi:PREDICTED: microtubule-associated protein TORTIFOLIA1-like [Tarenaya hassleriana]|uniref:microtubule-associated protein TORTIFOLIA1-like n=1 Tax=Tarenaya hassleriana TaxID=28532 RepID=UPI00053C2DAC|nr:PREDICTED: microtubule-associated protein TORTIFOLIA1-like [Tarenaya hassleriana]